MNALEVKIHLLKNGYTVTDIAKKLAPIYGAKVESVRTMLKDMFYYGKYNARLARLAEKHYDIKIDRPKRPQTVREAVQAAARQAA